MAAGMNNRVYYHSIGDDDDARRGGNEVEYPGRVRDVQLNDNYAVVVVDNKAHLHPIDSPPRATRSVNRLYCLVEGGPSAA